MGTVFMPAFAVSRSAKLVSAVVGAVLLVAPVWANAAGTEADAAPDAVFAVWTPQELQFKLDENPVQYTCQQFRDKIKAILLAMGARKDLHVDPTPCTNTRIDYGRTPGIYGVPIGIKDGPAIVPKASIRMQVLKALDEPRPDAGGIPAHWKSIDVMDKDFPLDRYDCTLAKQIVESLLPLFSTRSVEYNSPRCYPSGAADVHLRFEVLVTDQR
jgi:hypothetical protein